MTPQNQQDRVDRAGLLYGFAAYGIWGLVPLFWPLLEPAAAMEILAHRMVWSLAAVGLVLLVLRRWSWIRPLLRQPRRLGMITLAATVISVNWGLYIWSVNSGHVVETALGYFTNPLVSIAFGVLLLRERLRPAQWAAVGVGVVAVAVLTVGYGKPPWIALTLAFTFATYSLAKKRVGLDGLESLAAETAVQFLPALGFLIWLGAHGGSTFGREGAGHAALLASCGFVTALPLICFGASAVRLPLSTIGMLQYVAPTFQFALGLTVFHESMPPERWAGFALVWLALALLTWDALRTARRARRALADAAARAGALSATVEAAVVPEADVVPEAVVPEAVVPEAVAPEAVAPEVAASDAVGPDVRPGPISGG
ncbi:EamA family transporter RarD [Streptomyces iranensis]|uniref:Chloramphenicol-sensitive protein RarD n=1 Tax=Streptomyces iranensis TaxID=576784 RepID=A0A060ZWG6_9ACTN|nr:EamA family transporter RarD [Streptomyces iranensis]MBP2066892.1 chloramphenicol-sensitive protein RarD [Streptomyces iranensis]CDR07793.1 RarD protein, DMT superfamily transporter [Streptomyces iranensis]